MKTSPFLIAVAVLAGCATNNSPNEFSGFAMQPISVGIACVVDEVGEEGWTVTNRDEAGMVRAEMGTNWMDATLVPGQDARGLERFELNIVTANTAVARAAASEVIEDCAP